MENLILAIVWGDTLMLVAICFTMVLLIMALFVGILKIFGAIQKSNENKAEQAKLPTLTPKTEVSISEAEYVAIATAIHLYFDIEHDDESNILTINNISRNNSPWCLNN